MRSLDDVRRAIDMMFVRLSVRPYVCLSATDVHCDHTLHFSADLSLRLDSVSQPNRNRELCSVRYYDSRRYMAKTHACSSQQCLYVTLLASVNLANARLSVCLSVRPSVTLSVWDGRAL